MRLHAFRSIGMYLFVLSCLLFASELWVGNACAGILTIDGIATFQTKLEGSQFKVQGTYEIQNHGDEIAKNVFPSISLGSSQWAGEPLQLAPQEKHQWEVELTLPSDEFPCSQAQPCFGTSLAEKGLYPVLIYRHYEDVAGRRFSASSIEKVAVGELSLSELAATRAPSIHLKAEIEGDGQEFESMVTLRNLSETPLQGILTMHTSQELEVSMETRQFKLPGKQSLTVPIKIKNFSALPGSTYAAFPLAQWEEKGVRNLMFSTLRVPIQEAAKNDKLIVAVVSVIAVSALLLLAFVGYGPRDTEK